MSNGGLIGAINPMFILIGVVVGLVVLAIFGGMSILGANNSANLASATSIVSQFLSIIGVGVAIGLVVLALRLGGGKA